MTQPTDEELLAIAREHGLIRKDKDPHQGSMKAFSDFARAVLAKWGTPQQAAPEYQRGHIDGMRRAFEMQAAANKSLPDLCDRICAAIEAADIAPRSTLDAVGCIEIVRAQFAAHGIKGGQQPGLEPLIRQMLEALKLAQRQRAVVWSRPCAVNDSAITAARTWLKEGDQHGAE